MSYEKKQGTSEKITIHIHNLYLTIIIYITFQNANYVFAYLIHNLYGC
jgi:hypothetical protein